MTGTMYQLAPKHWPATGVRTRCDVVARRDCLGLLSNRGYVVYRGLAALKTREFYPGSNAHPLGIFIKETMSMLKLHRK